MYLLLFVFLVAQLVEEGLRKVESMVCMESLGVSGIVWVNGIAESRIWAMWSNKTLRLGEQIFSCACVCVTELPN